jgi:predicted nucleic-acid-binding protein
MLALDTNLLVRLVTNDDAAQAARVEKALDKELAAGRECWVGLIVLAEFVWVLSKVYSYDPSQCQSAVDQLISFEGLRFESMPTLLAAVRTWHKSGGDLADHLIGHQMQALGCEAVLTFDKKAARLPTHRLIS